jgi:hypothetical protein
VITVSASGARSGLFTINADRTYVWNVSSTEIFRGTWRNATSAEMQNNGGTGIVLVNAYGRNHWIVLKNNNATTGDEVILGRMDMRAAYFFGQRD